jgi:RNA polymerase sigma factor (sigma-70 family)
MMRKRQFIGEKLKLVIRRKRNVGFFGFRLFYSRMRSISDAQLLREYAQDGSEEAFTELAARYTNLVYSAALRQVECTDVARDVTQKVFIGLAQGAPALFARLDPDASLAGWLCRSARNISLNMRRDDFRRRSRERLAMEDLNGSTHPTFDWEQLRLVLDEAMSELNEPDYDALVIRFFQNQDLRSVGSAMGISDDTAQKRVSRALEKLRGHLARRGITATAAALSTVLCANAVQTAPTGLAAVVSSAALRAATSFKASTAISATKIIAMTTLQKALLVTTLTLAIGTGIYEARRSAYFQEQAQAMRLWQDSLAQQNRLLAEERDEASNRLAAAEANMSQTQGSLLEVSRLRAEVAKLRADSRELAQLKAKDASWLNGSSIPTAKSPEELVSELKARLGQAPDQTIPELQFITEQDWLNAVKGMQRLETESDIRRGLSALRGFAKNNFSQMVQTALVNYLQSSNGQSPTEMSQLAPYFTSAIDPSVLQRYEITQPGLVHEKATPLDDQDDTYYQISKDGVEVILGSVAERTLSQALQSFIDSHNGEKPKDPSQLQPYVKTPGEQAALQNLLQNPLVR